MFHLSGETQSQIIQLIFDFAGQLVDINISLSAFGLLWNVVPICSTLEMWKIVLGGAAQLIKSPNNDVALCAVNTFFSLIVSNAQSLPTEIFLYVALELFMPLIEFLADAPKDCEATQQLAFHELAHCGRNLWNQFKSIESFLGEFRRKLIAGREVFMKTCQKKEILMAAFQFYEEAFQCAELSSELVAELYNSTYRVMVFFVEREDAKSPIYGSIGRMVRIVLPLQKPQLTKELLKRWIDIIECPIFDLECSGILPPTSHKAMDGMVLLFPLPLELAVIVYESLVKMACNTLPNAILTESALEHLTELCHKVDDDQLPTFFVLSKHLFRLKGARKLLLEFVQKDIPIQDEMVEDVAKSLMSLGQTDLELREKTATSVLKMYLRLSNETKLQFIEIYKDSDTALLALLKRFCDPKSPEFVADVGQLCTKKAIQLMGRLLVESQSDEQILTVLTDLKELRVSESVFENCPEGNEHFHLFFLLPSLAELVARDSQAIRNKVKKILLMIAVQR
jgi:hypothetical protein